MQNMSACEAAVVCPLGIYYCFGCPKEADLARYFMIVMCHSFKAFPICQPIQLGHLNNFDYTLNLCNEVKGCSRVLKVFGYFVYFFFIIDSFPDDTYLLVKGISCKFFIQA